MDLATVVLYTVVQCSGGALGMEYQVFPAPNCDDFRSEHRGLISASGRDHGYAVCLPVPPRFVTPRPILNRYDDYSWGAKCAHSVRNTGD